MHLATTTHVYHLPPTQENCWERVASRNQTATAPMRDLQRPPNNRGHKPNKAEHTCRIKSKAKRPQDKRCLQNCPGVWLCPVQIDLSTYLLLSPIPLWLFPHLWFTVSSSTLASTPPPTFGFHPNEIMKTF